MTQFGNLNESQTPTPLYFAWAGSLLATLGSLAFSELMHLPPCVLCWYQRSMMYPLLIVLTVGIVRKDKGVLWYAWPLVIIGWLVALYHNLLYYQILPEAIAPCQAGISCTSVKLQWFGFLDIPLMSLLGFTLIGITLYFACKKNK